jgi:hypothetical protein
VSGCIDIGLDIQVSQGQCTTVSVCLIASSASRAVISSATMLAQQAQRFRLQLLDVYSRLYRLTVHSASGHA